MSFEPANLLTCDSNSNLKLFYSKYSRRNTFCRSRQNQAIQLWLHFQYFNSHLFYRRNRSLVKSTSGLARSHSRFSFDQGSRILQCNDQKSERYMLRYISIFREKYNCYLITGFGYKLATELTTCKFTHGISIIEQTSIIFARTKIQLHIMTFTLWLNNYYLSRHVRSREAYC